MGYRIVLDPYEDGSVPGYAPLRLAAAEVLCSHTHHDHHGIECITVAPMETTPWKKKAFQCPHDDFGGNLRGMNTIHVLEAEGIRVAHMGDVGCRLSDVLLAQMGRIDVLIVPVGGFFTISPSGAKELSERLKARIVIPMHYRTATAGYDAIGTLNEFTELFPVVHYLDSNTIEGEALKKDRGVIVLKA